MSVGIWSTCLKMVEPTCNSDAKREEAALPSICSRCLCAQLPANLSMGFLGARALISRSMAASQPHSILESLGESQWSYTPASIWPVWAAESRFARLRG